MENQPLKLNFGSGLKKYDGFTNLDIQEWEGNTDIVLDMTKFPYPFDTDTVDEIMSFECMEHITFKKIQTVFDEWFRILKGGGKITVQVPDAGSAMEYYVNKQICICVPHKGKGVEDFVADPSCWNCAGKAKIHPDRWLYTFTGAQKHEYDMHLNIFTKERMAEYLNHSGYENIEFAEHPYKIIVTANKPL